MARIPAPADPDRTSRTRGALRPAVSAAAMLAAFGGGSAAWADGPAPGNGDAIFRDGTATTNTVPADPPVDPGTSPVPGTPPVAPPAPAVTTPQPPPAPAPLPKTTSTPVGDVEVAPVDKPKHPATPTNRPKKHRKHKPHRKHKHSHHAKPAPDTDTAAAPDQDTLDLATPPARHVPDLVLERYDIPPFLLPVYQAAAVTYQVPWTVLAAINSVETDYGRNTNVSSAGAQGWMQFMPATWKLYGVDANLDGKRDPYNPADAIFAAARYLHAAGASEDLRRAVFAYNHADWYVDMVLERAKALSKIPADVIDSITGLAQARLPIPGKHVHVDRKLGARRWVTLRATTGRRVVAAADGRVVSMGEDNRLGRFVVIQDAFGNRFTYAHLGSLASYYAVPKHKALTEAQIARELHLPRHDKQPARAATRETPRQRHARIHNPEHRLPKDTTRPTVSLRSTVAPEPTLAENVLVARRALMAGPQASPSARAIAARAIGLKPREVTLRELKPGSHVVAGTIIGHVAYKAHGEGAPVRFAVRPAGHKTPRVDARPLLKGWRLLQSTAVYGPAGTSTLNPKKGRLGLGQALLMGKDALGRRVLNDPRIEIYECGRQDIEAGQIDRRVLATLEFLADAGLHPTVSALSCGHSLMTASGNISEHSTGDAVDIAAINGIPIIGHQGPGSITDVAVRKLLTLQGTMKAHQIITLMTYAGTDNTFAMADHNDHIHVGFHPEPGSGSASVTSALEPEQWSKLMARVREIPNPQVSTHVSRFAIPAKPKS